MIRSGLVFIDKDGDLEILQRLCRLVTAPGGSKIDATHLLLNAAPSGDLEWSDFKHVADDRDHVEKLVQGALKSRTPGVNILLYGPPGTGKTEFCKTLAARLGVTLFSVGETDDDGDEPVRGERLQELRLAQRLLAGNQRALLLFDEMEDLLRTSFGRFGIFGPLQSSRSHEAASKVFMHRLLEQTPAPTLWTMNDARSVSPAILRRMMFAFELRPPSTRVRARVWARQLDRHGIAATPGEVRALAAEFDAAPGVAAGATAAARLAGGDIAAVRRGVRSLSRLLSCDRPPQRAPAGFDPGLIRSDTDPAELADRLAVTDQRRFSLFHDFTAAIAFCRTFFPWYNTEHRHGGIAMLTPDDVHHNRTQSVLEQRGRTLQAAWTRHPERFVRGIPQPDPLPQAVWINPPVTPTTGETAQ